MMYPITEIKSAPGAEIERDRVGSNKEGAEEVFSGLLSGILLPVSDPESRGEEHIAGDSPFVGGWHSGGTDDEGEESTTEEEAVCGEDSVHILPMSIVLPELEVAGNGTVSAGVDPQDVSSDAPIENAEQEKNAFVHMATGSETSDSGFVFVSSARAESGEEESPAVPTAEQPKEIIPDKWKGMETEENRVEVGEPSIRVDERLVSTAEPLISGEREPVSEWLSGAPAVVPQEESALENDGPASVMEASGDRLGPEVEATAVSESFSDGSPAAVEEQTDADETQRNEASEPAFVRAEEESEVAVTEVEGKVTDQPVVISASVTPEPAAIVEEQRVVVPESAVIVEKQGLVMSERADTSRWPPVQGGAPEMKKEEASSPAVVERVMEAEGISFDRGGLPQSGNDEPLLPVRPRKEDVEQDFGPLLSEASDRVAGALGLQQAEPRGPLIPLEEMVRKVERVNELVRNLGVHLSGMAKSGGRTLVVSLVPERLGKVVMSCREVGRELVVEIRAENAAVRDLITRQEEPLRQLFEQGGYKLARFDVSTQGDSRQSSRHDQSEQSEADERMVLDGRGRSKEGSDSVSVAPETRVTHDGGVWLVA